MVVLLLELVESDELGDGFVHLFARGVDYVG